RSGSAGFLIHPKCSCGGLFRWQRQVENEGCPSARARAVGLQRTAEGLGREGAAVQAEAVAAFPCGESVIKNPCEIGGEDADAVVNDCDLNATVIAGETRDNFAVSSIRLIARLHGVAHEINENLHDLVL